MAEHHEAATFTGLLKPEHFPDHLLHDPGEILLTLRRMNKQRVLLNAHIDAGSHRFVSAVLDCGPRGLVLDVSPDEWLNTQAVASDFLTCSAQLDGVRIQFDLHEVTGVTWDDLPALFAPLPASILRLQRRQAFRMSVPMNNPVVCQVTVYPQDCGDNGDAAGAPPAARVVRPRVADVSMDGIALVFEADTLELAVGIELTDCLISLPDSDTAKVHLKVRNLHQTTNPNGVRNVRAGCEIVDMPARFTNQIQRYIFKIERERRLLESPD
ncbi:flagellar brake protein [Pseudazoarcus pumilus]|nr:flagellar brake protein [Pseudazoarcus pumilus]